MVTLARWHLHLGEVLVLVLVLNKDHVNHQKDAHHLASVYPGYILMSGVII